VPEQLWGLRNLANKIIHSSATSMPEVGPVLPWLHAACASAGAGTGVEEQGGACLHSTMQLSSRGQQLMAHVGNLHPAAYSSWCSRHQLHTTHPPPALTKATGRSCTHPVTAREARGTCARERKRTSCEGEKGCFVGPVSSTTGSVRGYLGLLRLSIRLPETLCTRARSWRLWCGCGMRAAWPRSSTARTTPHS